MKFTYIAAALIGAQAIKIQSDNEYAIYQNRHDAPPLWSVVKRGEHDFQDLNVEMAMKANPSNAGAWPVAAVIEPRFDHVKENKPFWAKQPWEFVVKKGNSPYNDKQVEKAVLLKKEPIRVPSEAAGDKKAAAEAGASATIAADVAKGAGLGSD